jgi:peroxiredoxin
MVMRKIFIPAFAVALVIVGTMCSRAQPEDEVPGKGDDFLDFTLTGLDGESYDTAALRGDKFSVVKLGQTTCPACNQQTAIFMDLHDEWKKYPLEVIEVYIAEPPAVVKKHIEDHKIPFTVLLDEDGRMADRYRIRFIPAVYVVDTKGKIIYAGNLTSKEDFGKYLMPLMKEELRKQAAG